ncbi:DUF547 domain-containing protein [Brumimicrobium glaciale]|jgi:hypothetical protein|uniref:DUF547 domain-containing protein n=1 Tax=Brumimicrobium glaciale TaxID=200475 RepID=A0A4Q4KJI3_9FLAO|nr:DUF547 domain-containing protein [Brumimicrobium glaciale]RYM32847.1 DUF547 domain-containing protein [Brumimicrobium glaciale]
MFILKILPYFFLLSIATQSFAQTDESVHKHEKWDQLTKKYVTDDGFVNYKGFTKDSTKLNSYLKQLADNHPNEKWTSGQKKAYWINAYNAFTIQLIIRNYPVKSIKDLGGSVYRVNTSWDIKFIHLGDETYDLNNIEHNILRKDWDDARVHAVVNCASVSCPALRKGAFTGDKVEEQMDEQMKSFINDKTKNTIAEDKADVSSLFKWFSGDFKNNAPSVIAYINKYSKVKIKPGAEITYQDYDWSLNEAK